MSKNSKHTLIVRGMTAYAWIDSDGKLYRYERGNTTWLRKDKAAK